MEPVFYSKNHYVGEIVVNGKAYPAIAFEDKDHNALYYDNGLWLDLDNNNKLDKQREHFFDKDIVDFGGEKLQLTLRHP